MNASARVFAMSVALAVCTASVVLGQTVTVSRDVNLRPEQTSAESPIRLLTPSEPPMTLLDPNVLDGYYHVRTTMGEEGYVWSRNVKVSATPAATPATPTTPSTPTTPTTPTTHPINLGPGVAGSASMVGCGDGLWQHVYHPTRLIVKQDCITVTGTIIDATANQSTHQPDGVRHEPDGDTHGWLKVDPQFASLINAGNTSDESGNLVFEIVCHFPITQTDAQPSCVGFHDTQTIPPVGSHVAVTGTFVTETNHAKWNEIHPVSSIMVQ